MSSLNLEQVDSQHVLIIDDNSSDDDIGCVRPKVQSSRHRLISSDDESIEGRHVDYGDDNDMSHNKQPPDAPLKSPTGLMKQLSRKEKRDCERIEGQICPRILSEDESNNVSQEYYGNQESKNDCSQVSYNNSSEHARSGGDSGDTFLGKSKQKKKSKKVDPKFEIAKETQRLEREKNLVLPYHRPKQRTLSEFLSQRKSHTLQLKNQTLRSTSTNMIHVWREIEESTKEAIDFFKSDSDEEDGPIDSDGGPGATECADQSCFEAKAENCSSGALIECDIAVPIEPRKSLEKYSEDVAIADGVSYIPQALEEVENNVPVESLSAPEKTECWLEDIIASEKKQGRIKKSKLDPIVLNKVPKLSMDDDFDEGSKCRADGRSPITFTTTTMTRTDRGELKSVATEVITLAAASECKPGYKFQKLKETLREQIESKWEQQLKQKAPAVMVETTKEDFEEDVDLVEFDDEGSEATTESEPEEDDVIISDKPRKSCDFGDSEAEESENDADDEHPDDNDNDDEGEDIDEMDGRGVVKEDLASERNTEEADCSQLPAFQPGGGLLMGGSVLSQLTQPLPFSPVSSPAISVSMTPRTPHSTIGRNIVVTTPTTTAISHQQSAGPKKNLFGSECSPNVQNSSQSSQLDDPFMFVSGAFPEPTLDDMAASIKKTRRIIIENDSEESRGVEENEMNGVPPWSSPVHTDLTIPSKPSPIHNSSSNATDDDDNRIQEAWKKKKKKLLTFSDDEVEPDDALEAEDDVESGNNEGVDNDIDDVAYDSEENEVRPAKPGDFFEQEAELSESEWSGDEDEHGLDKMEAEAGDADVLDQDQVASQLGRIHMRRLLDDDARDVRLLQELLFEDGDLHGDGQTRDRKFRWQNLSGFEQVNRNGEQEGSDGEMEEDVEMAKIRHEKAQFMLRLEKDGRTSEATAEDISLNGALLPTACNVGKPPSLVLKTGKIHGSVLCKGRGFASRFRKSTSSAVDGDGQLGPSHSRNFVFAIQDKQKATDDNKNDNLKRKATAACTEPIKRSRLVYGGAASLLDQFE